MGTPGYGPMARCQAQNSAVHNSRIAVVGTGNRRDDCLGLGLLGDWGVRQVFLFHLFQIEKKKQLEQRKCRMLSNLRHSAWRATFIAYAYGTTDAVAGRHAAFYVHVVFCSLYAVLSLEVVKRP